MNPASAADANVAYITIDDFSPDSAYPSDYINQRSSWILDLYAATTTSRIISSVTSMTFTSNSSTSTPSLPLPSSTPPPPPLPYATGTCSFHLTKTQNCVSASKNLFAIITPKDNARNTIGATDVSSAHSFGTGINDGTSYIFTSK
ncbi:hypothetical protein OCU04_003556 [Sclerotinia nivalis]|uniref:Uncharacterized protein n=1 Tax=Sclerotinia nivalis TaxID=352851 RepID=A0A9X0AS66_9HELO|nr:hypothetical protein OCU04_003556 [Sclerotinia nivalis]